MGKTMCDESLLTNEVFLNAAGAAVSELAEDGWQEFDLQVWSNGRGTWEYRAWAFDGSGLSPNNFATLGQGVRIFFDSVTIKKIGKLNLPSV
jgi:hypothetical protein